jgi:hypothetical protein
MISAFSWPFFDTLSQIPCCIIECLSWYDINHSEVEVALHLTWWLTYAHGHHNWQIVVVYFGATIKSWVCGLWVSAWGWDCHVMWPQLLSPCPDCSLEAQPKYVRGGKRYGRRSLPEFQESVEEFAEVTVIEPLDEEAQPSHIPAGDCNEVRCWAGLSLRLWVWTTSVWHGDGRSKGPHEATQAFLSFWLLANLVPCLLDMHG